MTKDESEFDVTNLFLTAISEGAFWLAIVLSFWRTADLLTYFSPDVFMGFQGLRGWFGFANATLVEGTFVVSKYRLQRKINPLARVWAVIMAVGAWVFSAVIQGLDVYVNQGRINELPPEMRLALNWIVPAIPIIVAGVITVADAMTKDYSKKTGAQESATLAEAISLIRNSSPKNGAMPMAQSFQLPKRGRGRPRKIVPQSEEAGDKPQSPLSSAP